MVDSTQSGAQRFGGNILSTAYDKAENDIGRKADKNRKIYNGMMKTYYYQFLGPRPPKKGSIKE